MIYKKKIFFIVSLFSFPLLMIPSEVDISPQETLATKFNRAIRSGDVEKVRGLFTQYPNFVLEPVDLDAAINSNRLEMVKLFCEKCPTTIIPTEDDFYCADLSKNQQIIDFISLLLLESKN